MDIQIKYKAFVETVNKGSITAAAESLGYTQPGVSRMIHALEEEWDIRLLDRGKKGVVPTSDGLRLYTLCQQLLEDQNRLEQAIAQIKGSIVGTIRIGAYFSVLMNWIPNLLERMGQLHPQLDFQMFEGNAEEQLSMLRRNAIDIGFLSSSAPEDFTFIPLYRDPIVVIMPQGHPLTQFSNIKPSDIADYPFLIKPEHTHGALRELLLSQTRLTESHYSVKNDNALLGLVNKGMGIGVVGEMVAHSGTPVEYRHFEGNYYRTIGLAVPNWKPVTPALQSFISIVCGCLQEQTFRT